MEPSAATASGSKWAELQYCCSGCRTAHSLLRDAGLEGYYAIRDRMGESGRAVSAAGNDFREFDSQAFSDLYCRKTPDGTTHTELQLEGVHCAACVWLVERLPRLEPAVLSARLNMAQSVVELEWRSPGAMASSPAGEALAGGASVGVAPTRATQDANAPVARLSDIARTLERMGYRPRPRRGQKAAELQRRQLRGLLIRMGIAGASAGNVMLMAFALYSGADADLAAQASGVSVRSFFQWASLVVSVPALLAGGIFLRGAWAALRTRVAHMDLPIALGILAGFAWGTYGVITDHGEIYFDSITALIFLLLVGRYLQARHQLKGVESTELLLSILPSEVERLVDVDGRPLVEWSSIDAGHRSAHEVRTVRVALDEVRPGQLVRVAPGKVAPVDGVVVRGQSTVDRSLLSGESLPQSAFVGEPVEAGCANLGGELLLQVERAGPECRVARLMHEVERAQRSRSPSVQMADRIAGVFTLAVLGLALLTFGATLSSGMEEAISRALSLLVIACPCALGLATPLALVSAVSQAARERILVFGPEALETLASPCLVVLDKTGTLTEGRLSVSARVGDPSLEPVVLAMERSAHHPVGMALRADLEARGIEAADLDEPVEELLGSGLVGRAAGASYLLGSEKYVCEQALLPPELEGALGSCPDASSPVLVARDGVVRAVYFMQDQISSDAQGSLIGLRQRGHRLAILSGDRQRTVTAVAEALATSLPGGVTDVFEFAEGDCSPEDKLARIRERREAGERVVMVGDGINDAAALSAARVGVAVSGASEASRLSADVFLASAGLSRLRGLFEGARRLQRTVRRGMAFSLCYNVVGMTLAAIGLLGPLGAAILMPLSSLTVITHAMRSRMFLPSTPVRHRMRRLSSPGSRPLRAGDPPESLGRMQGSERGLSA